ncbi:hypothetical protein [Gallibacterium anatis]|uniref:hypothetical protein n=1 Tax=Gallibacterium anatis TaxID=750 RepID=UPI0030048524
MATQKIIVWALFDSGNGCYTQAAQSFSNIETYPIGIDIEGKNQQLIQANLADFSQIFGQSALFNLLDSLPKPDVILASPPYIFFSSTKSEFVRFVDWLVDKKGDNWLSFVDYHRIVVQTSTSYSGKYEDNLIYKC